MTIDWERVLATTEEEIEQQAIEDGTADLDWSKAVRSPARALVIPEAHVIALKKAEALLWEDYAMRGMPEYKAAAEAVHALLADGAPC
jgi:hypothetical protein